MPGRQRRTRAAAGVARRRPNSDRVERTVAQDFSVRQAIERLPAREAQVAHHRFLRNRASRPHTSLDGLTPYVFATRFQQDHNVNRANL